MIDSIEVPSRSHAEVKHKLYFYQGKLKGCSCPRRKFQPRQECPHMERYRSEQRTAYNNFCLAMGI